MAARPISMRNLTLRWFTPVRRRPSSDPEKPAASPAAKFCRRFVLLSLGVGYLDLRAIAPILSRTIPVALVIGRPLTSMAQGLR
jgi:hypothetical protein